VVLTTGSKEEERLSSYAVAEHATKQG